MKKIIQSIIAFIFIALSLFLIYKINKLGLVPNKYLIIGAITLIVINAVASTLLFCKNIIPKVLSFILYVILIIALVGGLHVVYTTDKFLDTAFNNIKNEITLTYYVLSPNEHKEEELKDKEIYYLDNTEYVNDAIKELNDKYTPNMIPSMDIEEIIKNEYFLLDSATIALLTSDFNFDINNYHVIYSTDLTYEIKQEATEYDADKHYYNIFVGGHDFTGVHMDMNKIITVNTKTKEVLITNIHRYAYLDVPGYNQKNTLSSMGAYGVNNNIGALEQLLGIKFDYYFVADAKNLPTLVDDIGGIEYCSDKEYTTYHKTTLDYKNKTGYNVHVKKGCQQLNGIETLTVARERLAFYYGAQERDNNTTEIMIDILEAMKKPSNVKNYASILNDVSGLYQTSIPREVITNSAKELLNSKIIITKQTIDGHNGINKVNFSNSKGAVLYVDEESLAEAIKNIKALDK